MNNVYDGVGIIRMDREIADKIIYTKTGYISCQDGRMTFADGMAKIKFPILPLYASKREKMLGGHVPELSYNTFTAPDPVEFVQHVFGLPDKD